MIWCICNVGVEQQLKFIHKFIVETAKYVQKLLVSLCAIVLQVSIKRSLVYRFVCDWKFYIYCKSCYKANCNT